MYKNQLQELAQRSCFSLPSYVCTREGPDHAPRFKATVTFNGETFHGPTCCTTLRQAEHAAAEVALARLSTRGPSTYLTARVLDETGVYKNLLQETAHRAGLKLPAYTTVRSGPGHSPVFASSVELAGLSFAGEAARTKKQAEKNAAMTACAGGAQGARQRLRRRGAGARGRRQSARRPEAALRRQCGVALAEAALPRRLIFFLCSKPVALQTPMAASELPCRTPEDAPRAAAAGRPQDTASAAHAAATGAVHLPSRRRAGAAEEDRCGRAGADAGEGHGHEQRRGNAVGAVLLPARPGVPPRRRGAEILHRGRVPLAGDGGERAVGDPRVLRAAAAGRGHQG
ncbi:hypothetical protein ACQJBY_044783 [Aegilops geniculata]